MPLEEVLTHLRPFGPVDQVRIEDLQDAVEVLDVHEPLASAVSGQHTLIYGRKGCGKSAAISLIRGMNLVRPRFNSEIPASANSSSDSTLVIHIDTWRQFLDMNTSVNRQILDRLGTTSGKAIDYDLVPPEALEAEWINQLWEQIFRHIYDMFQDIDEDDGSRLLLKNVFLCFNDAAMARMRGTPEYIASSVFGAAKSDVINYLSKSQKEICILFDSLEKYPITNETFGVSMSGFLRAMNAITSKHPRIRVVFTLPEELILKFRGYSENILKDFERSHPIRWRNRDLWRISAHRYRLFLGIHDTKTFDKYNLEVGSIHDGQNLNKFFKNLLPEYIVNELGIKEASKAYILRHTHLLPRHIILLLNEIASISHDQTGQWDRFSAESIVRGILKRETDIASQVLQPYRALYPDIEKELPNAFSDLPPIFSYGELQKRISRIRGSILGDHIDIMHLIYGIGIIGRLFDGNNAGIYTLADFSYSFEGKINFSGSDVFCLHPIFSRYFDAARHRAGDRRVIFPRGIPFDM